MSADFPILSLAIWLPIIGGILVLTANDDKHAPMARVLSLVVSILTFIVTIPLYTQFDTNIYQMQFSEMHSWISTFNINYNLGIDGISMPLILLTSFTSVFVIIAGWEVIKTNVAQYMAAFLIMEGLMIGVFCALETMLFYVFWEALVSPMCVVVGKGGGTRRVYATMKFFLYTFFGSVFMLVSFIYMYYQSGSLALLDFHTMQLGMTVQILIFIAFLLAFAVKIPMFPVHTWLPDAHVEAPTAGSVVLAAIMLKMGGYGFVRFVLPITPVA